MSSVTRFIKQIQPSEQYLNTSSLLNLSASACEFVPAAGNVPGNYSPGFMVVAPAALIAAIANAAAVANVAVGGVVLRDMGKTVYAQITNSTGNFGYFRQVQLLAPQPLTLTQGSIGGVAGNSFGVLFGSPDAYSPYLTFYLPTVVKAILASPATISVPVVGQAVAGQM
jgi:hypothetical protein